MNDKILSEIETGQQVELRKFQAKDVEYIPALFRAVYGEGYPIKTYYNPPELLSQTEEKKIILFVVKTPGEEVVACTAFYNISPNKNLYEHGLTLVLPSYRKRGINNMIFKNIYSEQDHLPPQIHTVLGEPVCNHVFMQNRF
ncbi:MAG: hypothetical protein U9Q38_06180 [Thermodesulfobacteriota bacterium]|nr:hypothetical protein [Thermodesulfobacteriota bacterium]